ncbi:MAG: phage protease [Clostridia bacterium]|nr:phage protease [Clostridia bacterium]
MNKRNLELLGLEEGATLEDVERAYAELRAKLLEDRFLDGEAGNEAARRLTRVETAHDELLAEYAQFEKGEYSDGAAFAEVEQLIKDGNLTEAQRVLDQFNERGAQWHYLQSVVFYRKNWVNESKKQLEIAMRLDGDNQKYKEAYEKLNEKIAYDAAKQGANPNGEGPQSAYQGQDMNSSPDDQMGGSFCSSCVECCALNACINCLCSGCCR